MVGAVRLWGMGNRLTLLGIIGSVIAAICCFTPFLPFVFGALGLSGLLGYVYRDAVLLPILSGSLLLVGLGIWLKKRAI